MLKVNEIFGPTIQGEGKSSGKDVMFVRLSFCNLTCVWCDTPYTWKWQNASEQAKEVHALTDAQIFAKLVALSDSTRNIVVSGGEPLVQQKKLVSLLALLKENSYFIEVETNGTVVPLSEIVRLVDQFNCSPKLANSGVELKHRFKPKALKALSENGKTNFKFVISSEQEIDEIVSLVKEFQMKEVYLMPEGRTVAELNAREQFVQDICKQYGFCFTQRLHIIKYGSKRGV